MNSKRDSSESRIDVILDAALALPVGKRAQFVRSACGEDRILLGDVMKLVEAAESGFLERPVRDVAGDMLRDALDDLDVPPEPILFDLVGRRIRHYQILERIGVGGMAIVYKAYDTKLNRSVALKFLTRPIDSVNGAAQARFIQEARAVSALDHPNICGVYEINETGDGRHFISMPFYEGETLKTIVARGPLPFDKSVDYCRQIALGLQRAHQAGVVHRDVKPANVLVARDGTVRLLDFGLAKIEGMSITRSNATPGTAAYMSPEQAQGLEVDERTDIWSLGVVLYEMLTALKPFQGDNAVSYAHSIVYDEPIPIRTRRTDVPPVLAEVVAKMLSKSRADRYRSADDLLLDLSHHERLVDIEASIHKGIVLPGKRARRWNGAVVSILLAFTVFLPLQDGTDPRRSDVANQAGVVDVPAIVVNETLGQVLLIDVATNHVVATAEVGDRPSDLAITPDGAFVYVANRASNNVSVIRSSDFSVVETVGPLGTSPNSVAITPDGAFAYVSNFVSEQVSVIRTATNVVVTTIPVGAGACGLAVTPDGNLVYVATAFDDAVSVISTATNTVVATVAVGNNPQDVSITADGTFAYVSNYSSRDVAVIDVAANTVVAAVPLGGVGRSVTMSPDGAYAYVAASEFVKTVETSTHSIVSSVLVGSQPWGLAVTPDGDFLYATRYSNHDVAVISTSSQTVVTNITVGAPPNIGIAIGARTAATDGPA